jgi:hypothetical protein
MAKGTKELLKEALQLPLQDRAELAAELLETLEPGVASQSRSEAEWIGEVQRRARMAMAGTPGLTWDEALTRVSDRLAGR